MKVFKDGLSLLFFNFNQSITGEKRGTRPFLVGKIRSLSEPTERSKGIRRISLDTEKNDQNENSVYLLDLQCWRPLVY